MNPGYFNNIISIIVANIIPPFTLFFGVKSVVPGLATKKKLLFLKL